MSNCVSCNGVFVVLLFKTMYNRKQLLDSVFVISGKIIKVEVGKRYKPRPNVVFFHQALVDELEQRISQCHTKGMEDEEDYERASKALGAATGSNKAKRSVNTPAGKYPQRMVECLVT